MEVVLDRRGAERRRRPAPVDAERRRGDRRRPTVPGERQHWLAFGYRLVRREEAS